MKQLWDTLKGYKTYIVAVWAISYALYGYYYLHQMTFEQMMMFIFGALGISGLRHGISTEVEKYIPFLEQLASIIVNSSPATPSATPNSTAKTEGTTI